MSTDLRTFVGRDLRWHPRVAYQGILTEEEMALQLAGDLPPMPPFRNDYVGAISVLDWDHRLPSKVIALRIFAYYSEESLAAGQEAYDDRLEEIGRRDRYPEFDVPDFDHLVADEAYEIELSPEGELGRCRLTSSWRRDVDANDGRSAVDAVKDSPEFIALLNEYPNRPPHLGDLEAVSWTPPGESQQSVWTLDVWYLLTFDGRMGAGQSFLVTPADGRVLAVRDFSVRTG